MYPFAVPKGWQFSLANIDLYSADDRSLRKEPYLYVPDRAGGVESPLRLLISAYCVRPAVMIEPPQAAALRAWAVARGAKLHPSLCFKPGTQ